jgi:hypothetical protein
MANAGSTEIVASVKMPVDANAKVSWGVTSTLGVAASILAGAGAVIAAINDNDAATATGGVVMIVTAVTTLGGRYAQAVTAIKTFVRSARPWIDAAQEAAES